MNFVGSENGPEMMATAPIVSVPAETAIPYLINQTPLRKNEGQILTALWSEDLTAEGLYEHIVDEAELAPHAIKYSLGELRRTLPAAIRSEWNGRYSVYSINEGFKQNARADSVVFIDEVRQAKVVLHSGLYDYLHDLIAKDNLLHSKDAYHGAIDTLAGLVGWWVPPAAFESKADKDRTHVADILTPLKKLMPPGIIEDRGSNKYTNYRMSPTAVKTFSVVESNVLPEPNLALGEAFMDLYNPRSEISGYLLAIIAAGGGHPVPLSEVKEAFKPYLKSEFPREEFSRTLRSLVKYGLVAISEVTHDRPYGKQTVKYVAFTRTIHENEPFFGLPGPQSGRRSKSDIAAEAVKKVPGRQASHTATQPRKKKAEGPKPEKHKPSDKSIDVKRVTPEEKSEQFKAAVTNLESHAKSRVISLEPELLHVAQLLLDILKRNPVHYVDDLLEEVGILLDDPGDSAAVRMAFDALQSHKPPFFRLREGKVVTTSYGASRIGKIMLEAAS